MCKALLFEKELPIKFIKIKPPSNKLEIAVRRRANSLQ